MNIFLSLAVFFTFLFIISAIQSINFYIAQNIKDKEVKTKLNPYGAFYYALIASVFWGLI